LAVETLVTQDQELGFAGRIGSHAELHKILGVPFEEAATSHGMDWASLEAAGYRERPAFEFDPPAIACHRLVYYARPPEELDLRYEGVTRQTPPRAGSISVVPAGYSHRVRSSGCKDELHVYLDPDLVARVAAEAFELDSSRLRVPPLDRLDIPQFRAAMLSVSDELSAAAAGGRLAAESLANILAVQLIRHILAPRSPSAAATARCRRQNAAPSSSISKNTSTPA
jgi:AraC family transcriptional regulator